MAFTDELALALEDVTAAIKAASTTIPYKQITADYTLVPGDAGCRLGVDGATLITITVDASVFEADKAVLVFREGAGAVTIAPASGTTFRTAAATTKLGPQYSLATVIFKSSTVADINGELAAS